MTDATTRVRIWDAPVRLFHWSIATLFAFSWWSAEAGRLDWHRLSGYAVLTLVLFRVMWGLAGSDTARFSHFLRGPSAALSHLKGLGRKERTSYIGHNPLGGWAVIAMLGLLLAQSVLGLFAIDVDGIESGPLAALVSFDAGRLAAEAHHFVFNALLALVVLHLAAIAFYALVKRDDIVGPMISGAKCVEDGAAQPKQAPLWRAVIILGAAAGLTFAAANAFWRH